MVYVSGLRMARERCYQTRFGIDFQHLGEERLPVMVVNTSSLEGGFTQIFERSLLETGVTETWVCNAGSLEEE